MLRRLATFFVLASSLAPAQSLNSALPRAMNGRAGAAVVLSVESGKILASYHPQVVAQRVTKPGSAVKPFTLLELLRSGSAEATTELACRRRVRIGSRSFDCVHVRTIEPMNAERALAYSCNSYFVEMATRLTDSGLTSAFRRAGFGSPPHLVHNEASGTVTAASSQDDLKEKAIGEHSIEITPLQLAAAYRQLAMESQRGPDASLTTVLSGMRGAVAYGTAQGAKVDGLDVAGKTGTSAADEGRWTHGWFAGFAPAGKPAIVAIVFLERGHGSEAANIAGQILCGYKNSCRKQASGRAARGAR